ncbi:MAG: trypsin-like peptidase domain-containing protein [Pseudomonadota bacterium]
MSNISVSRFKPVVYVIALALLGPLLCIKFGPCTLNASEVITFERVAPKHRESYAPAVQRAAAAVVSIHTKIDVPVAEHPLLRDPFFRHFFGGQDQQQFNRKETQPGLGSGVVVHKEGYVLTNYHVIQNASSIKIALSTGEELEGTVVGTDPETDLAVLKINAGKSKLAVIPLGYSDKLEVGDIVLAIGNPLGIGQTVTQGVISATKRTNVGLNTFENYLQTDASINPGNSGGALIDSEGNLIGINTAIVTNGMAANQGIGFAIPIDWALDVLQQLIADGQVVRGWLGITLRELNPELRDELKYAEGDGVVIAGIARQGPAQKAGLAPGDILVSINNQKIGSIAELLQITAQLKPETHYPISAVRNGQMMDFRVLVGKRPKPDN